MPADALVRSTSILSPTPLRPSRTTTVCRPSRRSSLTLPRLESRTATRSRLIGEEGRRPSRRARTVTCATERPRRLPPPLMRSGTSCVTASCGPGTSAASQKKGTSNLERDPRATPPGRRPSTPTGAALVDAQCATSRSPRRRRGPGTGLAISPATAVSGPPASTTRSAGWSPSSRQARGAALPLSARAIARPGTTAISGHRLLAAWRRPEPSHLYVLLLAPAGRCPVLRFNAGGLLPPASCRVRSSLARRDLPSSTWR